MPLGLLQPGVGGQAEVDPADLAQRARVTAGGSDLLAGQQRDAVPGGGGRKLTVVTDRVVIGDRDEVQTQSGGKTR